MLAVNEQYLYAVEPDARERWRKVTLCILGPATLVLGVAVYFHGAILGLFVVYLCISFWRMELNLL